MLSQGIKMNKIIALSCVGMLSFILSGCGDSGKNTITYDFKENKITLGEFDPDVKIPGSIQDYSYVGLVMAVYKNCDFDEKAAMEMRNAFQKGVNYTTKKCSNGITYKFINTDKAPQEY